MSVYTNFPYWLFLHWFPQRSVHQLQCIGSWSDHGVDPDDLTDAGHEIKTPITIINADTEVLEMDTGPNEWIDDIRVQTERLSHLTKDLIYLARIEEGENQTQMIEFPLSELISEKC